MDVVRTDSATGMKVSVTISPAEIDDLAELEDLTDDILCKCLHDRYMVDKIYTYVGSILIAMNPFRMLGLYTSDMSAKYTNVLSKVDHPPHLFAIADAAFHSMVRSGKPQVCVISGESGAGKTESAKQFIRQIMDVSARGLLGGGDTGGKERARHPVEGKILQQNPILEAFGNAKTIMNDNSSRFGKFIELKFDNNTLVAGATMSHYLLEKARIVMQGPGERNYHIFGMMFAGMEKSARDLYRLTSYEDYRYLPEEQGDMGALAADWKELNEAYAACNFSPEEVDWQNSALAAVLLMGQLDFQDGEQGDAAVISNNEIFDSICHVLMLDGDCLKAALMTSVFTMRGETITKHLNVLKCINARNATAKALYDRLFRWLVFKINLTLVPDASDVNSLSSLNIGILDIFGFENFKTNGFDQMCINLANEKLHFFFNQHIFQAEMGSYAAEGIDMSSDVMFHDNKAVIEMFFRKPAGLLGLLDEESGFDRATASSLLDKFNKNLVEEPLYKVVKGNYAFEVVHFAATIKYHTDGFLEKNTDPLPSLMAETCRTSDNTVVRTMFTDKFDVVLADAPKLGRKKSMFGGFGTKKGNKQSFKKSVHDIKKASIRRQKHAKKELQTVSNSFRASLDMLMLKMGFCEPHFVRCIKPNPQKQPQQWENDLVMRQMQYTGMMQTVQMRREGFPFRIPFVEFFNSYHGIVFDFLTPMKGSAQNVKELLERLEAKVELEREERGLKTLTSKLTGYRVAKTMVFLKYWHPDILEAMSFPFGVSAITIQRVYRGHMARKRFKPLKQRYRDDCAAAVTFIDDMTQRSARTHNTLETLLDEERAKGPIGLGIQKPPDVKAEKKQAKHAGEVEVNQKKFEKDLNKIKKKVVKWWVKYERAKQCHLDQDGSVYPWFHGLISRVEAEDYLFDQDSGAFLIRVSERVNGYALSFRYKQRIRHYKLGFSSGGGYEVLGCTEDFATLIELIEYFQLSPITPGEDDLLGEPVPFAHDLGLGITQDETVLGKRPPKLTQDERAEKAKSMSLMNILDDESAGSPMADETFLEDAEAKPHWLRGKISRGAAEDELRERGMTDGRFVVREKLRSAERIVLALSVTFRRKFYHHLLARQLQGEWLLDEKPLDYSDSLDEVIAHLQKKKSPRLAGLLEKDPYASPEDLTDAPPEAAATAAVAKPSMVPAPASTQVLVPSESSSIDDVATWLASLGMSKYIGKFYSAKYDGKKLHRANEKQLRKLVKNEDDYRLLVRALR